MRRVGLPWRRSRDKARVLGVLAGSGVVGVGLLVLVGWLFDVSFLKGPVPGLVQMKADAAIGFLALGAALLVTMSAPSPLRRRVTRLLAGVAVLIGVLTLFEYVLGRNLGLDELLFRDSSAVLTVHRGRLAPQTAINFTCLGLAILFLTTGSARLRRLVGVLTGFSLVLAMFALIGYAYGATALAGAPSLTPIALHSAITFVLLCVGIAVADPAGLGAEVLRGQSSGSVVARRLLPLSIVVFPVFGWLRLLGERHHLYSTATGAALLVLVSTIVLAVAILSLAKRLNRLDAARRRSSAREGRLAALVNASNEAIMSADIEGRVTTWNHAAEQLYGYSEAEILGQPVSILSPPENRAEQRDRLQAVARGEVSTEFDTQRLHRDGTLLDVSVTVSRITQADGALGGYCAVTHDIRARVRARDELFALLRVRTRELDQARLEAFHKLALAGEYRDDETRDHTRRVGEMSAALAARIGLDGAMVEIIRQVAPLHDLGKIGISDTILLKPGKLTETEFATMKQHAAIGAEILAGSDSPLFRIAAQVAGSHHERWDGGGYPAGLAGNAIPVAARIVGLMDAFDALTHERPYKAAWPVDDALAEIVRCAGSQFDPRLVAAFAQLDHAALLNESEHHSLPALSDGAWETLNGLAPPVAPASAAIDERTIATAFRDTSRAVLIADDDRRYINVNSAACRLLGTTPEELIGKRIDDFAPPELRPGLDAAWSEFLSVGTQSAPFTIIRTDGAAVTVQFTALAHFVPGLHLSILEPISGSRPPTENDSARLKALQATGLLDSPPEESYDRFTRLVATALDVPTALVSLVDEDRQFFKSQVGLSEPSATERQTPLSHSFCKHAVATDAPVIVTDANKDPRFHTNPAIDEHSVVAYLGVPIRTPAGHVLGSLCAIDRKPRLWTDEQVQLLERLSALLSDQIANIPQEPQDITANQPTVPL